MKNIKALTVFLILIALLCISFVMPIHGSTDYSVAEIELVARKYLIKVNGQPIKLDVSPIWDSKNNDLLIPLRSFADLLGFEIKWNSKNHIASFRKKDIYFEIDVHTLSLKSATRLIKSQIVLKNNRILLDSNSINKLFRIKSDLNQLNLTITFYIDRSQIHMIAPDFSLKDIPGKTFNLYKTLQSHQYKLILLTFYSSKCPICARAYPSIEKLYEDYKDKGVLVIGINTDTQNMEEDRDRIIAEYHLTYPILLDVNANVYSLYSVSGIPNLFLVNPNKEIVQHQLGFYNDYFTYLRAYIDKTIK